MTTTRTIEIFSAGCAACEETVALVKRVACPSCEVTVLDMHNPEVARRAKSLVLRTAIAPPVWRGGSSAILLVYRTQKLLEDLRRAPLASGGHRERVQRVPRRCPLY